MTTVTKEVKRPRIFETKKTGLMMIDPRNIEVEKDFNARVDYGNLQELADSIKNLGQLEPARGYKKYGTNKYILTDGHRRLAAIKLANEQGAKIPYVLLIHGSRNPVERLYEMAITGLGKKPLEPIEEASVYAKLREAGEKVEEIAVKSGKSLPHIYTRIQLLDLDQEVQDMISKGDVSPTTALHIFRQCNSNAETTSKIKALVKSSKTGKKITNKNVSGIFGKTTIQKLEETLRMLVNESTNNKRVSLLSSLLVKLRNSKSTANELSEIFR